MAFTYNLESADPTTARISRVRLEIGDTTEGAGVRPEGTNLQDAEIAVWLSDAENVIAPTVGACCAALARMWAVAADIQVGERSERLSQVAAAWAKRASALGVDGGLGSSSGAFSAGLNRDDGYAAAAEES